MYAIAFLFIAYLIGSFPSALVIGKAACNIDIREHGSKNLGATNAVRVLGKKLGLFVFFLDVMKGIITVGITKLLYSYGYTFQGDWLSFSVFLPIFYGAAAVIGHFFPIFAKFKGGKAVATSLGICIVFTPIPAALCLIAFGIILKLTGYVSLSSTIAIIVACLTATMQNYLFAAYLGGVEFYILFLYYLLAIVIIFKHRKNYLRILNGTENSFKKKKDAIEDVNSNKPETK